MEPLHARVYRTPNVRSEYAALVREMSTSDWPRARPCVRGYVIRLALIDERLHYQCSRVISVRADIRYEYVVVCANSHVYRKIRGGRWYGDDSADSVIVLFTRAL